MGQQHCLGVEWNLKMPVSWAQHHPAGGFCARFVLSQTMMRMKGGVLQLKMAGGRDGPWSPGSVDLPPAGCLCCGRNPSQTAAPSHTLALLETGQKQDHAHKSSMASSAKMRKENKLVALTGEREREID